MRSLQNPETDIKFNVGFTVKPPGFSKDPETHTLKTKNRESGKFVPMKKNLLTSLGSAAIAFFSSQSNQQQSLFLY